MKKILFISNYESFTKVKDRRMPSQHLFGFYELNPREYTITYKVLKNKTNKILDLLYQLYLSIQYSIQGYDVIFDALAVIERGMGILKKLKILRQRYVAVMHHPPFDKRLRYCNYDAMIFLDKIAYQEILTKYPRKENIFKLNVWGPDLNFYSNIVENYNFDIDNQLCFISNGKTDRDHNLLIGASSLCNVNTIIVCDKNSIPSGYHNQNNIKIFIQNHPDDVKMVKLLNKCSVMVIPTFKSPERLGPIGNTSFMDAIALGMPVIVADNSVMSDIVDENKLGFVYKAGDINSLISCMNKFKDSPELVHKLGSNSRRYAESTNMNTFSKNINNILYNLYAR